VHFKVNPFSKIIGELQSLFGQIKSKATNEEPLILNSKIPLEPPFNMAEPPGVCTLILLGLFKSVFILIVMLGKQFSAGVLFAQLKNRIVSSKKKHFFMKLMMSF
jgi:hypothetical protein